MKVGELIDKLREFDSNAEICVQIDRRHFAFPVWIGFMDTAGLFEEETNVQLVISVWEPAEHLRKPDPAEH